MTQSQSAAVEAPARLSFVEKYRQGHQHPLNRATHYVGIPMIIVSPLGFVWGWEWFAALFVVGWIFQFVGHFIEGNRPAFFSNPIYLLVGPWWLARKALRTLLGKGPGA